MQTPDPRDPVALTHALCAVDSTTGREAACGALIARVLEGLGLQVERQPVEGDRFNVLARTEARPEVVLSTHFDTVPPYVPVREDGAVLYGRGVSDAKGILAAEIAAAARLLDRGERRIGLLFTVDEEASSAGAKAANDHPMGREVRYLVNGEPTDGLLASGTKGSLRVRLAATGRAGHSAYAEAGHSALHDLLDVLAEVRAADWPTDDHFGETTVNVGTLHGGVAANVFAPTAEALLQIRLVTPPDAVLRRIQRIAAGRCTVEVLTASDPIRLYVPEGWPSHVMRYVTDVPYLFRWGTPLLFGPGSILVAHTDDERITAQELRDAADAFVRLVDTLLTA
jgi:acetylornithine deacetylase